MPQLEFDPDIIEIPGGRFFKLSSRRFTDGCPYNPSLLGKVSPRIFKKVNPDVSADGGFFKSAVLNSFPEVATRMSFLMKFYQCLLAGQLPMKTRKLCLRGRYDSGKTSFHRVLFGLTQMEHCATISKEKIFGKAMVTPDTMVVFIDEMTKQTLPPDEAKVFLQGGLTTVTSKGKDGKMIENRAGKILFFSQPHDICITNASTWHTWL